MEELNGKVAFITGGASGIGLSMAEAFGREGMSVMLADIEAAALERALTGLREQQIKAEGVIVDVASREAVRAAAEATIAAFGKVHVVCNNAGVGAGGPLGVVAPSDWDWVIDVNLKGVVYGVEVFAPLIEAHGEGGHFVNTASLAGMVSPPGMEPYCATKFAVVAMSEGWAQQLAAKNIGVSVLCPGYVKTRINESRRNRPAAYGPDERSPPPAGAPPSPVLSGIDVAPVGRRVVEAVKANELYIFTHPGSKANVAARFERILAAFDAAEASLALADIPRSQGNVPANG
ncbi:MAG TPA: SDR family NAD(P)-dependent oxidoreductase [Caulobacteraceae bacterium]|jgi:NAD(P)-dependent dehydrogenase (short-subunit alcohol dehydrogenase family)